MNIYILLAHPDKETFNGRLADACEQQAILKGHIVRRQNIGEMQFDPVLWKGYKVIQELEPDLKQAQENIKWCNKWVLIYPVWMGSFPAIFKGFLDRVMLPGFAFHYHDKDPLWDKLLKGRSAEIIATSDAPGVWLWFSYHNSDKNTIKNAVLSFCGFSPVKFTRVARMKYLNEQQRSDAIKKIIEKVF